MCGEVEDGLTAGPGRAGDDRGVDSTFREVNGNRGEWEWTSQRCKTCWSNQSYSTVLFTVIFSYLKVHHDLKRELEYHGSHSNLPLQRLAKAKMPFLKLLITTSMVVTEVPVDKALFAQDTRKQKIYVLYGLGGAGKTQIALKFIDECNLFTDQYMVDASTTETIVKGLKPLATPRQTENSMQDALEWLAGKHEDWLLLFDNADDPKINLNQFFPKCNHGNIIITSRNPNLRVYGAHSRVSDLDELDAVSLLLKCADQEPSQVNELVAAKIVKVLCYLPLAIVQAGAFILESESLDTYLDVYMKNQAQLLKKKPAQKHDDYAWAVYSTWEMSFSKLSPQAAILLQLCSFIHHDDISEEIFSRAANHAMKLLDQLAQVQHKPSRLQKLKSKFMQNVFPGSSRPQSTSDTEKAKLAEFLWCFVSTTGEWNSYMFIQLTNEIKAYSLINHDTERKSFSIHPLVHSWGRTTVLDQDIYHSYMVNILGMSIREVHEEDMQLASLRLVSHVDVLMQSPKTGSEFYWQYANIYYHAARYTDAVKLDLMETQEWKKLRGNDHSQTLDAMHNLALTYSKLGQFEEAKVLEVVVLEKRKKLQGDDHPKTLDAMGSLVSRYNSVGHLREAEKLGVLVLEKRRKLLGNDHPKTIDSMHTLATIYDELGQWEKGKILKVSVLEKKRILFGEDHPRTLEALKSLAMTHHYLGQFDAAKKLQLMVLEKQKKILGDNHPDTARSMQDLTVTYNTLGHFEDAEKLIVMVLEKRRQLFGHKHPETLDAMHSLAATFDNLGRFDETKELKVVVLENWRKVFGDDHPRTLSAMHNLASSYNSLGQFEEAEILKLVVLEKRRHLHGDDHFHTLDAMYTLALTYDCLGQSEKAKELQSVVLEKRKKLLGDDHVDTLDSMYTLATLYNSLGQFEDAQRLGAIAVGKQTKILGDSHPSTIKSMHALTIAYDNQNQLKEAEELKVALLKHWKRVHGTDNLKTLNVMDSLAATYIRLGQFEDAEKLKVVVIEKQRRRLGDDHPDILKGMGNLAMIYVNLGRFEEAKELMFIVLKKQTKILGDNHPDTLHALKGLALILHMIDIKETGETPKEQSESYKKSSGIAMSPVATGSSIAMSPVFTGQ
ncbi:hypothetical protein C8R45DRAFT_1083624 [Mycena sanguinolenta]|nr:hypothetical protein C8R45DRAFT_1083624 [Mycena sanguinolenta]